MPNSLGWPQFCIIASSWSFYGIWRSLQTCCNMPMSTRYNESIALLLQSVKIGMTIMNAVLICCRSTNSLEFQSLALSVTTRLITAVRLMSWLTVFILFSISSPCSAQTISSIPVSPTPQSTEAPVQAPIDITKDLTVSSPVTHKNLSVYFLHRQDRDDREFLTLNEGLKSGLWSCNWW